METRRPWWGDERNQSNYLINSIWSSQPNFLSLQLSEISVISPSAVKQHSLFATCKFFFSWNVFGEVSKCCLPPPLICNRVSVAILLSREWNPPSWQNTKWNGPMSFRMKSHISHISHCSVEKSDWLDRWHNQQQFIPEKLNRIRMLEFPINEIKITLISSFWIGAHTSKQRTTRHFYSEIKFHSLKVSIYSNNSSVWNDYLFP